MTDSALSCPMPTSLDFASAAGSVLGLSSGRTLSVAAEGYLDRRLSHVEAVVEVDGAR